MNPVGIFIELVFHPDGLGGVSLQKFKIPQNSADKNVVFRV